MTILGLVKLKRENKESEMRIYTKVIEVLLFKKGQKVLCPLYTQQVFEKNVQTKRSENESESEN